MNNLQITECLNHLSTTSDLRRLSNTGRNNHHPKQNEREIDTNDGGDFCYLNIPARKWQELNVKQPGSLNDLLEGSCRCRKSISNDFFSPKPEESFLSVLILRTVITWLLWIPNLSILKNWQKEVVAHHEEFTIMKSTLMSISLWSWIGKTLIRGIWLKI